MVKVKEMPIRQEKVLSSEFHMAMLVELERHHDEKSLDWSETDPHLMMSEAAARLQRSRSDLRYAPSEFDPKQLVHAANYLMIAYSILKVRSISEYSEPTV